METVVVNKAILIKLYTTKTTVITVRSARLQSG